MNKQKINILITCIGRRVSLMRSFCQAARRLGLDCRIVATDTTDLSPALQCSDKYYLVEPTRSDNYLNQIEQIVQDEKIDLLVPTIDLDLAGLAGIRDQLRQQNCLALISAPEVIEICQDKRKTYQFLKDHGFVTPQIYSPQELLESTQLTFPYFLKPWDGHASRKNRTVRDREELAFYSSRVPNCMAQNFIVGQEHTIDILVDLEGKVRCAVPRRRLQVRDGEVIKSVTVKNYRIIDQAVRVVELLKAGPGVITIQCFLTEENTVAFIEINPRFGGGVPLSIEAGADFPKWIIQFWLGQNPRIELDGWKGNLYMLRYDDAVWMQK